MEKPLKTKQVLLHPRQRALGYKAPILIPVAIGCIGIANAIVGTQVGPAFDQMQDHHLLAQGDVDQTETMHRHCTNNVLDQRNDVVRVFRNLSVNGRSIGQMILTLHQEICPEVALVPDAATLARTFVEPIRRGARHWSGVRVGGARDLSDRSVP
eukprot:920361-Heterocapsa_arctica.AAC.2